MTAIRSRIILLITKAKLHEYLITQYVEPAPQLPGGRSAESTGGAWAEDRATRGRDPSADPGAKTAPGGTMPPLGIPGLAQKR